MKSKVGIKFIEKINNEELYEVVETKGDEATLVICNLIVNKSIGEYSIYFKYDKINPHIIQEFCRKIEEITRKISLSSAI